MKLIYTQPLRSGYIYHIYNQGNNSENIFKEERNYFYFLKKYREFIAPIAHTYAWCLLPNHFHLLVQFKTFPILHEFASKRFAEPPNKIASSEDIATADEAEYDNLISHELSRQFANFFSGYTRAINNAYARRGKLFSVPFRRIQITDESYFEWLICYIHRNPIHHGFCKSFEDWAFSSYGEILNLFSDETIADSTLSAVSNGLIKSWFGTKDAFLSAHQQSLAWLDKNYCLE